GAGNRRRPADCTDYASLNLASREHKRPVPRDMQGNMAETTAPTPEESGQPQPPAAPLVRRWHELESFADRRAAVRETERQRRRHVRIYLLLLAMMALGGAFAGLLTWVHPVRGAYFLPLWITEYESRLLPVNAQADHDRAAFQEGGYFPRIDENAFASQERHLLAQELSDLKNQRVGP